MAGSVEQDAPRDGIPAATVVIFRHAPDGGAPQILMQVRSRSLAFAGGMAVFPGGRVDPSDYDLAREAGYVDIDEAAHQIAAIRETLEETGLALGLRGTIDAQSAAEARAILLEEKSLLAVLERMGWSIALNDLVPFARWFPKNERLPRIFDTRFYIADLGTGAVDIAVDAQENTRLFWTSARDALAGADRGEIDVIFPTRRNLERLAQFDDFGQARDHAQTTPLPTIVPWIEERPEGRSLCIPEGCGYPVTSVPLDDAKRG
ncbi:NUDIX domain-containing protein [Citromicrobium bathyomarinum]|uniref:NUDIX hydrolase n=1 Tax=Citromicrobium TaxID=72173 RepID=UPI0001DD0A7F|nr:MULTISPECIES: NUDIX domain-containing protein [Citromicrobium]MAO05606.1 NUDIX domain-containing protein [Citromicrobium sp.]|tara:strand:- start:356 stop:1141 length:786 start_codon:yes stop_codon:yes gene_type:complete